MRRVIALFVCLFITNTTRGETIELKNGVTIAGRVLKADDSQVVVRLEHNIMSWPRSFVTSISEPRSKPAEIQGRLANWAGVLDRFADSKWVNEVREIPATVVDKGVLANVPYSSYRCGNYEVNVYGDPDDPAGVEIGVYKDLLENKAAKQNCRQFIASILRDQRDRDVLQLLDENEDSIERKGLTIEVTPPTAEDAYEGWWISIYSTEKLTAARATNEELKSITVAKREIITSKPAQKAPATSDAKKDEKETDTSPAWSPQEVKYSRTVKNENQSIGDRVYVRGYYRKNGTYVKPHSRRK